MLVDWDAQEAIWHEMYEDSEAIFGRKVDTRKCALAMTEPYFNLPNVQSVYDQFVFEEYGFGAYHRCAPVAHILRGDLFGNDEPPPECAIVVDCGFSYTHVVPLLEGEIMWSAVRRIDIGGKLLTNHLKEQISFRQWDMLDETCIVEKIKEEACFVSADFGGDVEMSIRSDNPIALEYVLPDIAARRPGYVRNKGGNGTGTGQATQTPRAPGEQVLEMDRMRFQVPEVVFTPGYIGAARSAFFLSLVGV